VHLTGNSSVRTSGLGVNAIFANSSGNFSNGQITVQVDAGSTVSGGTATSSASATGIALVDGNASSIVNAGTVTTVGDVNGVAIRTESSNGAGPFPVVTTVTNTGTIVGEMLADPHTQIIPANQPGATLVAGTRMALGGGTLTNAGVLEIAGAGRRGTTRLEGSLVQTPEGRMVVDLAPYRPRTGPEADRIDVIGRARLAGNVQVRFADFGEGGHGRQRVTLLTATDGVDYSGLSVIPSAVAQFQLEPGSVVLSYDVNFANPTVAAALNRPQLGVASYLEALHVTNALPPDFAYLGGIGTAGEYARSLDRLSPEPYATNLWAANLAATRFGTTMLDCRGRATGERVVDDRGCFAAGVSGWQFNRDNDAAALGYQLSAVQFSVGAERQLSPEWAVGGSLRYDRLWDRADGGIWNGQANLFQSGLFVRRNYGEFALTAAVLGGLGSPTVDRYTMPTTVVHGSQDLHWIGGTVRAEQPFAVPVGTLRPMLDVNVLQVWSDGLSENGSFGALQVGSASKTNVSIRPALEWSMDLPWGEWGVARPRIGLGLTQYLSDPSPGVSATFLQAAGAPVAPMRVRSQVAQTYGDLLLGLDFHGVAGVKIGANVFAQISGRSNQVGGGLQLRAAF
jgi:hypothetical protein